jgi:hypothetical protein
MVSSIDKHIKIDEPIGTVYQSTKPCPITVADPASSDNNRADEITIETAKTSKVTAVVAVMSIFCKKDSICLALIPGMRSFLTKRHSVAISQRKILWIEKPFS